MAVYVWDGEVVVDTKSSEHGGLDVLIFFATKSIDASEPSLEKLGCLSRSLALVEEKRQ